MGKGGICIHYTACVVSAGVRRLEGASIGEFIVFLLLLLFLIPIFSLVFLCLGGLLGEGIRMSVSAPFGPSWDTTLSLKPTSAHRGTDKGPTNQ